jgi:hypothetical protein
MAPSTAPATATSDPSRILPALKVVVGRAAELLALTVPLLETRALKASALGSFDPAALELDILELETSEQETSELETPELVTSEPEPPALVERVGGGVVNEVVLLSTVEEVVSLPVVVCVGRTEEVEETIAGAVLLSVAEVSDVGSAGLTLVVENPPCGCPAGQIGDGANLGACVVCTSRDIGLGRCSATSTVKRIAYFTGVGIKPVDDLVLAGSEAVDTTYGRHGLGQHQQGQCGGKSWLNHFDMLVTTV